MVEPPAADLPTLVTEVERRVAEGERLKDAVACTVPKLERYA